MSKYKYASLEANNAIARMLMHGDVTKTMKSLRITKRNKRYNDIISILNSVQRYNKGPMANYMLNMKVIIPLFNILKFM